MKRQFKSLLSKRKDIGKDFLSILGIIRLIFEILLYFFAELEKHKSIKIFIVMIFMSIVISFYRNRPKKYCKRKLRDIDSWIEIKIGDIFKNEGAIIVPINDYLDLKLGGNVKRSNSIQNRMIKDYFGKVEYLESELSEYSDKLPLDIGTIIDIGDMGFPNKKHFYLLINSKKQKNNHVSCNTDDFMVSINKLWDYIADNGNKGEIISVPLISAQHNKDSNLTRSVIIKQLIDSFIEAAKSKSIIENVIISIYPDDLTKGDINFQEICDYLTFQTKNYKKIEYDTKSVGTPYTPSTIKKISY
ncbi:MAG TPA: DUF6430 domain-containing protein [Candidatus Absconditabacterales bacterium]|nr:DUF6430 domain-containing protein [Candidatus Absconditabacterales bacterium]HOQ78833.1 DUF6430 domain-containing protein [Candidatus Absconditabacterales bacterium]HPK27821.1 DUF6430 domain-containing protein [Candidatus Absconditabacterales bacterium]